MALNNFSIHALVWPRSDNKNKFLANVQFKIYFDSAMIEIKDCSIYDGDNGKTLMFPSRKYELNGEDKYLKIVHGNPMLIKKLTDEAIKQYDIEIAKKEAYTQKSLPDKKEVPKTKEDDGKPWDIDL